MKKKIDLYNIEELQKIALSNEEVVSPLVNNDIINFLNHFKIKSGRFKINSRILYSIYKTWSKEPRVERTFFRFVNRILEKDRSNNCLISLESIRLHQDLYEFLNKNKKSVEKVKNYKAHFESFIKYCGFTPGDFYIKESALYYIYDAWTYKNKNKSPLGEATLLRFFNTYFEIKKTKENNKIVKYLGINKDNMKTTLEQLEFASKWNEIRYEKKRESKKRK